MNHRRKPLINLTTAIKLYGSEKTCFGRPRFVAKGFCEWCNKKIINKRRTSCCCKEHSQAFLNAVSPVMYANIGSVGGYRGHILRRDKYTCQVCGEFHGEYSPHGVPLPTTDGQLDVHHVTRVKDGGTDDPDNLITVCRACHKQIHRSDNNA